MDEMTAFERQLAAELDQMAGPGRRIDGMAMVRTMSTRSPKWRFQSMFSATKFVVAGAILALFGGFLLAGVLTQPSEELLPVGATASAEVQPTEVPTPEADARDGQGTFRPAGSLSGTRSAHRAPLLPDGRVPVIGGIGPGNAVEPGEGLRTIEIWHPETTSFTSAGTLTTDRAHYHEAALLPNGQVLVVGGIDRTAEVWDPETESSTYAGSLPPSRPYGSQTILPDGRVLFVGGEGDDGAATASAVVWDSETATSAPAGTLMEARHHHSATVLADGRVLIVGGSGPSSSMLRSAEVWDPATLTFSPAGTLTEGRTGKVDGGRHTATLLADGRVLIVGGGMSPTASAEVWDPATLTFSPAGTLAHGRADHTASLLPDGRVLVVGGWSVFGTDDGEPGLLDQVEIWDPRNESFTQGPSLQDGRIGHTATVLADGRVLVIGGGGWNRTGLATAVVWEPQGWRPELEAVADPDTIAPDLLPGVDLVTEEVEPGVYRVLSDGVRDLSRRVNDVEVTSDGDVWVSKGRSGDWRLVRLGERSASQKLGGKRPWWIGVTADDAVVATSLDRPTRVFDGETWIKAQPSAFDQCLMRENGVLGLDGGCWLLEGFEPVRIDPDGSRTTLTLAEIGLEPDLGVRWYPKTGPDGRVWYRVARDTERGPVFEGLLAYDGVTWSFIPYDGDDAGDHDGTIGVDADGVVWVGRLVSPLHPSVLRWDGQSWTAHLVGEDVAHVWPWPNGILWLDEVATRWDGATLRVVEPEIKVPAYLGTAGGPNGTAPDGSLWLARDGALYVVTPEAVATAE